MKTLKEQVAYLREFVVDGKNKLFERLIQERTAYVTVVLEDLYQSHNQSAVMRSADCFGIQHVHLIENRNQYDPTSTVSQGAREWLTLHRHKEQADNTQATLDGLRAAGYRIIATTPHTDDVLIEALVMYSVTRRLRYSNIDWHLPEQERDEVLFQWYRNAIKAADEILERFNQ